MRDKGWDNADSIIESGIVSGHALEIGPGPGYIGLEWLKKTTGTTLTACEISPAMIRIAEDNAREYGFSSRVKYTEGNCMEMPFPDESFDAIFSNGSLHEWEKPVRCFNEIQRLLKPGGLFCICDMRRDVSPLLKWIFYSMVKQKEMRPGYLSSLNAAYTVSELECLLQSSDITEFRVTKDFFGLTASGRK
jgi:ubiquinone/menaquinone biosynthesis C-methylase UbiE